MTPITLHANRFDVTSAKYPTERRWSASAS